MEGHVKALGIIYIVVGGTLVLVGMLLFGIISGAGVISGDHDAAMITGIVGTLLGGFIVLLALPSIVAGIGLLYRQSWARVLTIILGVLHLFGFPIGTAIGIYTLWVLLNAQVTPVFARTETSAPQALA